MARSISDGSGITADPTNGQTVLHENSNGTVALPEGIEASSMDLAQQGQDLVLTAPDGQVFVIENYFSMPDAPAILSSNGAQLTPALVQSFLKTAGDIQLAANEQSNDASPVGEVTETNGIATVTHADGTKETITDGTKIFEGDIIETDAKGAVNITFIDESTFAVSENARLAVDDFSFNPSDQSGSTGLSILRGVFMFTSGLIGRENPDAVHLDTPVGSIGIRGTIIGGNISEGGQSQISVIEGAIVVRNGTGEQILSSQFETVQLTSFNAPISNIGTLDAGQMTQSYNAVRSVSPTLFTSIDDTARDSTPNNAPQNTAPETQPNAQPEAQQTQPNAQEAPPQAPPANEAAVFQTLNTGSKLDSPTNPAPEAAPPPPPAAAAPAPISPTPLAPLAPQQPLNIIDNGDRRPPAPAAFISGGTVAEEAPIGTVVGTVAMQANLPFAVTYTILNNPGNKFAINPTTGVVTLASRAGDYDAGVTHHDLTVRVTRTDTGQFADSPLLSVSVTAVDEAPIFNANPTAVGVTEGASVILTGAMIGAGDPEGANSTITYNTTDTHKGVIQVYDGTTWNNATSFTQSELTNGKVRYVHDGSEPGSGNADFNITATDGTSHTSNPRHIAITVTQDNDAPILSVSNGGTIAENSTHMLTPTELRFTDSDTPATSIIYTLTTTPAHGILQKFDGSAWVMLTTSDTFTQADINTGNKIRFTQNGDENSSDEFNYSVTDGLSTPITGSLTFSVSNVNDAPVVLDNSAITMDEGTAVLITDANFEYIDADHTSASLTFTITGTTHGIIEKFDGATWNSASTFTQDDINNDKVRFVHNGDEAATASFDYELSDGVVITPATGTFNFNITPVNDAPASIDTLATGSFDERNSGSAAAVDLGAITINDAEAVASNPAYSFSVQAYNGSSWVSDSRFSVIDNSGTWHLQANAFTTFDHETEGTIQLRVVLTDGANTPINSGTMTVTINDVNEPATAFTLNNDQAYETGTYDALVQGRVNGATIGVLNVTDPDVGGPATLASRYHITGISGGGAYIASDFEIVDRTDDNGAVTQVLKLKDSISGDFSNQAITLTIKVDANLDGDIADVEDFTQTVTLSARNDALVLETLNGKNGFHIENDIRLGGAQFGNSLTVGDINGDGKLDLIIGAPQAVNGTTEESGGIYSFLNGTTLKADATNGEVNLSNLVNTSLPGYFTELTTAGDDTSHYYGAHIAALAKFNGTVGADIAITNPGDGTVEIRSSATGTLTTTITNIPTGGLTGDALADAITVTSIGDYNGDGYSDLLIGAPASGIGQAGIILGGSNPAASIDFSSITQLTPTGSGFGAQVKGLGDINGDGYADFAISAPDTDTNGGTAGDHQGSTYLYFGASNIGGATSVEIYSATNQDLFGQSLAAAGDFNGDGLADVLIRSDAADSGRGSISLIFGNENLHGLSNTDISTLNSTTNFDGVTFRWDATDSSLHVGNSISKAGDFNGDGYDDIVIDVSRDLGSGSYEHTLHVVYGSSSPASSYNLDALTASEGFTIKLLNPAGEFLTLESASDINGDGYDDLFIGDTNDADNGSASIVYGSNYDGVAQTSISGDGSSIVGDSNNNALSANGYNDISFRGGDGNDSMSISTLTGVRNFDGGAGTDTLKLFFSADESSTPSADLIDLAGLRNNVSSLEVIEFSSSSKQDTLKLDIKDIIQIAQGNDEHSLRILGTSTTGGNENALAIYDGATQITNLSTVGYTKDVGSNGQDSQVIGSATYWVYTNTNTGDQLLVDARLAGSQTLAG